MQVFEMDYFRPDEVARLLRVSVRTIRRWAARGKIEHVHTPGKAIRISQRELARLLDRDKRDSVLLDDIDSAAQGSFASSDFGGA